MQMPLFGPGLWSVTQLTRYVRQLLEEDEQLQDVWIQGEVSNFSRPGSGHLYFTLKDSTSALRCVMWRNAAARLLAMPRDGEAIEAHGSINVYEASGQYQLYVDLIRPAGQGWLYQEFLRLKGRLEAEGLFAEERKRPLPAWPHTIGIVSSPNGAAIRDILNTIRRRYPLARVILAPTAVQGAEAPVGILKALGELNKDIRPDVIILARGGGSIEDLWAFNDERVARAIAASDAPVVSGVGHETDFTIADFVSDLRAPTPTAAAELCTPNRIDLLAALRDEQGRMGRAMQANVVQQRWEVERLANRLLMQSPTGRIRTDRQRIDDWLRRADVGLWHNLALQRAQMGGLSQRLAALNPSAILGRGYALVKDQDGQIVRSVKQIQVGNLILVQVSDGAFEAQATRIAEEPQDY